MTQGVLWKRATRLVLHELGGLALVRWKYRTKCRILMFHSFTASDRESLDSMCQHLVRHFEPVSLSSMVGALEGRTAIPENAVTVTVDDGYRSFLEHGYPVFRKHRIPAIMYAVSGFVDGRLWLWADQVEFALEHTAKRFLSFTLDGKKFELSLGSAQEKAESYTVLVEALKLVPNRVRVDFVAAFGSVCGVDIPPYAPVDRAPMSWDELRAISADGVEIGCHTETHPILSRVSDRHELFYEIRGSKELLETNLGQPVEHFCYPNGRAIDISEAAAQCVREAGFSSAATTSWGLNTLRSERMHLHRIPFDSNLDIRYGAELLAGLHL